MAPFYGFATKKMVPRSSKTSTIIAVSFDDLRLQIMYYVESFVVRWAIWYHLYNLKKLKNIHEGVLILVKLQS